MQYEHYAGECPFTSCHQTDEHVHPKCPTCGSILCGNLFCRDCRDAIRRNAQLNGFKALLLILDVMDLVDMGVPFDSITDVQTGR